MGVHYGIYSIDLADEIRDNKCNYEFLNVRLPHLHDEDEDICAVIYDKFLNLTRNIFVYDVYR
jgi:hypothetical protein